MYLYIFGVYRMYMYVSPEYVSVSESDCMYWFVYVDMYSFIACMCLYCVYWYVSAFIY